MACGISHLTAKAFCLRLSRAEGFSYPPGHGRSRLPNLRENDIKPHAKGDDSCMLTARCAMVRLALFTPRSMRVLTNQAHNIHVGGSTSSILRQKPG
jgi:hypothetical protein